MKQYTKYLHYLIKHKWYVLLECFKIGLYWQGIVHDLSKFRPDEFIPYARYFNGDYKLFIYLTTEEKQQGVLSYERVTDDFHQAWLKHQHRNPHHWQFWCGIMDGGREFVCPMEYKYAMEMICDWIGAGKAITGEDNTRKWYEQNKNNIRLHPRTRFIIENYIEHHYE